MQSISIDTRGVVERLAAELEKRILTGELPPGSPLRESRLAHDLGLSRNTVREALRSLVAGALVRHSPRSGFSVTVLSEEDVRDLYRARAVLELAAAEQPMETLRELVPELERAVALFDPADPLTGFEADHLFHTTLVGALGSRRLVVVLANLLAELRLVMTSVDLQMETPTQWRREHEPLIERIREGDRDGLVRGLRDHLLHHEDSAGAMIAASP